MQIIQHFLIQFGEIVNFFRQEKKPHGKQFERMKENDSKIELRVREKNEEEKKSLKEKNL